MSRAIFGIGMTALERQGRRLAKNCMTDSETESQKYYAGISQPCAPDFTKLIQNNRCPRLFHSF